MADAHEIKDELMSLFRKKYENDKKLESISNALSDGDYNTANEYSIRLGELLGTTFKEGLSKEQFPEGITYEEAIEILPSLFGKDHEMVSNACVTVQNNLNKSAKIGIKAIKPEYNADRVYGLAKKISSYDDFDNALWVLEEPCVNFSQDIVSDSMEENIEFQYESGMSPKIVRIAESGCCEWCAGLEGEYDYDEVKNGGINVFARHANCRCTVTYEPGNGRRQNVHTKRWIDVEELESRKQFSRNVTHKTIKQREFEAVISKYGKDNLGQAIIENHEKLGEYTPATLKDMLENKGFTTKPLTRSKMKNVNKVPFEEGGGYKVNFGGDGIFQYHPEGGRHTTAYYKISTGKTGKKRYNLDGSEKDD
ncbi:MAG: hypothetical protein J6D29_04825 [Solobacterium sp.]|nr:hypothetical protein [Solobacterium sp.]